MNETTENYISAVNSLRSDIKNSLNASLINNIEDDIKINNDETYFYSYLYCTLFVIILAFILIVFFLILNVK